jgi:ATP-dependent RNA helicase DHX8/PRP22
LDCSHILFFLFSSAEFIIDLAAKNPSFPAFKQALTENGAEFPDSFMSNLLRIIQLMKPPKDSDENYSIKDVETLTCKFPGLAMPNQSQKKFRVDSEEESDEDQVVDDKKEKKKIRPIDIVDDMMAELEALAPKTSDTDARDDKKTKDSKSEDHVRKRSKSRDRKRSRSRERDRKRSRSKDRSSVRNRSDRNRDRSTSRDKRRKRSHSRERRRSRSRDRTRHNRDRSSDASRSRRDRSRSPRRAAHNNRRSRSKDRRDRRRDNRSLSVTVDNPKPATETMKDDPEAGKVYEGKVANIVPFGCFVQLMGIKKRWEGLVHISQLRAEGRVSNVSDVVARAQNVRVKVISIAGQKVSLSMKDVDQNSGRDLNPLSHAHLNAENELQNRNPDRPMGGTSMLNLEGNIDDADNNSRKRVTRISSPERWEIKQMISSGVIDRSEMPDFDEETGLLPKDEDGEADIEIEIVEDEPPFLQGHGRALHDLSPVRIVKNPDGSLAQAAMMQSALAKERREHKMLQREQEMDSVPNTSLNKNWIDPLPDGKF